MRLFRTCRHALVSVFIVLFILFDADEAASGPDACDARASRAHEGVEYKPFVWAHGSDQILHEFHWLLGGMYEAVEQTTETQNRLRAPSWEFELPFCGEPNDIMTWTEGGFGIPHSVYLTIPYNLRFYLESRYFNGPAKGLLNVPPTEANKGPSGSRDTISIVQPPNKRSFIIQDPFPRLVRVSNSVRRIRNHGIYRFRFESLHLLQTVTLDQRPHFSLPVVLDWGQLYGCVPRKVLC